MNTSLKKELVVDRLDKFTLPYTNPVMN